MKRVYHILQQKVSDIIWISPDASVFEGLKVMMEKNISALLIIAHGELKGIFSERDYARKIILLGRSSKDTVIGDVMTANLITVVPDDSVELCMQIMTEKHIRHLPVVENGKVLGMVSIGDVVKSLMEDQKETIQQLQSYISGSAAE